MRLFQRYSPIPMPYSKIPHAQFHICICIPHHIRVKILYSSCIYTYNLLFPQLFIRLYNLLVQKKYLCLVASFPSGYPGLVQRYVEVVFRKEICYRCDVSTNPSCLPIALQVSSLKVLTTPSSNWMIHEMTYDPCITFHGSSGHRKYHH